MTISSVVVAYNAAAQIQECLTSVAWADEIIVVDLHSDDNTVEIARRCSAKVISHDWVPFVELVRESAVNQASGDWVLYLEPDERVPATLAATLREIAWAGNPTIDAVRIPRQEIWFGRWMKYGGHWPRFQLRFGRKGAIHFPTRIHIAGEVADETRILELEPLQQNALIHYRPSTVSALIEQLGRYSQSQAKEQFDQGIRYTPGRLIAVPLRQFYRHLIKMQAYRDGAGGIILALVWQFLYWILIEIQLWELSGGPDAQPPEAPARSTLWLVRRALSYSEVRRLAAHVLSSEIPLIPMLARVRRFVLGKG